MSEINKEMLITRDEAAVYLDVTPGTLKVWATTKKDVLPFYKPNGRAHYKIKDLDAYINSTKQGGVKNAVSSN